MPKCHFCDHNNPVGIDRCQNCGAWIERKAGSTSTDSGQQAEPSPEPGSLETQLLRTDEGRQEDCGHQTLPSADGLRPQKCQGCRGSIGRQAWHRRKRVGMCGGDLDDVAGLRGHLAHSGLTLRRFLVSSLDRAEGCRLIGPARLRRVGPFYATPFCSQKQLSGVAARVETHALGSDFLGKERLAAASWHPEPTLAE